MDSRLLHMAMRSVRSAFNLGVALERVRLTEMGAGPVLQYTELDGQFLYLFVYAPDPRAVSHRRRLEAFTRVRQPREVGLCRRRPLCCE